MMYQNGRQVGLTFIQKFNLVAGVILPVLAITVEATTNLSARMFLDPIPTSGHLLLVLLVPLTQLQVWFALHRNDPNRLALAGVANAVTIAVSLFYSFVYLPLVPVATLTLLIAIGILPLAPFFALIAALTMRKQLSLLAATAPRKKFPLTRKGLLAGLALTGSCIALLEVPPALTRYGLRMATSESPETRTRGIRFLRDYGSRDYLLRRCYDERGGSLYLISDFFSSDRPIKTDEVRDIYYRVTGTTFDASPPPRRVGSRQILRNDLEFEERTGETTSAILKDVSLSSSNLNGSVDPDGGVGHLDWTLAFDNDSRGARKVRAEIQLPPGAVVSSVTKSDEGGERATEFTGRSMGEVATDHTLNLRAPVLVTTAGRDRILVRYTVSGLRKGSSIRIGITVPLVLESKEQARLVLPYFNARNFQVPAGLKHWILIDSTRPLNSDLGLSVHSTARSLVAGYQLWGELSDAELMRPETALRLSRTATDHGIWSHNPFEVDGNIVKQSLEERTPSYLRRVVVVVDSSASMAQWKPQIMAALGALRSDLDVQLVVADGDWHYRTAEENLVASGIDNAYVLLTQTDFVGGADNVPALNKAWDLATATPGNNAIVWIHSPQRTLLEPTQPLINRWETRFYGPALYAVQTTAGSDEIEKKLDGIDEVKSVVRLGSLRSDLERLFSELSGHTPTFQFVRSVKAPTPNIELEGSETSDQLARLWANDEVARILRARDNSLREAATMLAVRYQLITPASGAVVTSEDTVTLVDNAEPEPQDSITFTEVQQPDFGSLLFLGVIFFVYLIYLKTRKANIIP